jgi:OOP family OmpA-OmpF porin
MKSSSNLIEKSFMVWIVLLLFAAFLIYSENANAQLMASADAAKPDLNLKTSTAKVNILEGVNFKAKASLISDGICSPYAEFKPAFAPYGDKFYFSRALDPNNTGGAKDKEDIWYAKFDTVHSHWSEPTRLAGVLNNEGPNYIQSVSMTGDTVILGNQYGKKGKMKAGVSYSVNIRGEWTKPIPIVIKNDYNISTHANQFVSLKRGIIISAVQRTETVGDRDLYISFWNGESATEPVNMGSVVNSTLEESSPYLSADNTTLYFASKGHNSFGGYDIFVSNRLDDTWTNWSEPKNLGPAVNGLLDEEFFCITHCGEFAVFSKQVSVHNVDLFKVNSADLFGKRPKGNIVVKNPKGSIGVL